MKQLGSTPLEKSNYGTLFLNPMIIIKKNASYTFVLDARHLNSNTDKSFEFWPLEVLAAQLLRAHKKSKSAIDLMFAYAHATLVEEPTKLTGFSTGDKRFAFIRGLYGLEGLPNVFT